VGGGVQLSFERRRRRKKKIAPISIDSRRRSSAAVSVSLSISPTDFSCWVDLRMRNGLGMPMESDI
jgi:hypothetical protein